ncbi:Cell division cycle protein 123 [Galdieria sulphuraria]|nr:Cell division cycle protein 123 [Galdieria sulphuraria]
MFDKCVPRLKRIPCNLSFLQSRINSNEDDKDGDSVHFEEEEASFLTEPSFPAIESAIDSAIKELGGTVFPKLCKAPIDASWISYNHDLNCNSTDEVLTVLKCSERVTKCISELCDEQLNNTELELREWFHVHPGGEWRCFVKDDSLRVKRMLTTFFESHKEGLRGCWVIDVYMDEQQYIWVFDVESFATKKKQDEENIWGLFSKEEVEEYFHLRDTPQTPVIRILDGHWNLFHNHKKWKSGMPLELRTLHAAEAVQKAVSITVRQQQQPEQVSSLHHNS